MQRPVTDEELRRRVSELGAGGPLTEVAARLNISVATLLRSRQTYFKRGLHLSEGARGQIQAAGLGGLEARGGWTHSYDEDGKKTGATRWTAPETETADYLDRVAEKMSSIAPIEALPPPPSAQNKDLLTIYPIADAHIGMKAWKSVAGADWSAEDAVARLRQWVAKMVEASPPSDTAIILDVGDLTHADDHLAMTPRSKHVLDVSHGIFDAIDLTIEALVTAVECAARKHKNVIVKIIPGNHNPNAFIAVLMALHQRYLHNPQITIEKTPAEFFIRQFGKVMLAAHHGDKAKPDRMVHFIADEYAEIWGKTKHRTIFTGHLHHHKSADIGGMRWEQLRALTDRDAHSFTNAYCARAQLQAITYHREYGEYCRFSVGST